MERMRATGSSKPVLRGKPVKTQPNRGTVHPQDLRIHSNTLFRKMKRWSGDFANYSPEKLGGDWTIFLTGIITIASTPLIRNLGT